MPFKFEVQNRQKSFKIFKWSQIYSSYPASGFNHLQFQRVSQGLILKECHCVTAGQTWEHVPMGQKPGIWNHLRETNRSPLHHSPHIQVILCESSCLQESSKYWWNKNRLSLLNAKNKKIPLRKPVIGHIRYRSINMTKITRKLRKKSVLQIHSKLYNKNFPISPCQSRRLRACH